MPRSTTPRRRLVERLTGVSIPRVRNDSPAALAGEAAVRRMVEAEERAGGARGAEHSYSEERTDGDAHAHGEAPEPHRSHGHHLARKRHPPVTEEALRRDFPMYMAFVEGLWLGRLTPEAERWLGAIPGVDALTLARVKALLAAGHKLPRHPSHLQHVDDPAELLHEHVRHATEHGHRVAIPAPPEHAPAPGTSEALIEAMRAEARDPERAKRWSQAGSVEDVAGVPAPWRSPDGYRGQPKCNIAAAYANANSGHMMFGMLPNGHVVGMSVNDIVQAIETLRTTRVWPSRQGV
ncbi:MAG TPA: hypothetical protein VE987_09525, partial [Polyangiaceae bacterium]|nr:hypothetical protein [Polyangiaceae bacterium]